MSVYLGIFPKRRFYSRVKGIAFWGRYLLTPKKARNGTKRKLRKPLRQIRTLCNAKRLQMHPLILNYSKRINQAVWWSVCDCENCKHTCRSLSQRTQVIYEYNRNYVRLNAYNNCKYLQANEEVEALSQACDDSSILACNRRRKQKIKIPHYNTFVKYGYILRIICALHY